jgi:micrococcal nuclease
MVVPMRRIPRVSAVVIAAALGILLVTAVLLNSYGPRSSSSGNPPGGNPPVTGPSCKGTAACFTDTVTHIVDGDTLDVGSIRIRLTLVNSPEVGHPGYAEAKEFTNRTCPVGTQALVDEDDGQTGGSYGRMVALVVCQGTNLNAELLRSGNAVLVPDFCAVSEFARDAWTGCP